MKTLVRADQSRRLCIRGAKPGGEYLVQSEKGGWWITPAPQSRHPKTPSSRNRREWAGSKLSLDQHLQALADLGFSFEPSEAGKQKVGPCETSASFGVQHSAF